MSTATITPEQAIVVNEMLNIINTEHVANPPVGEGAVHDDASSISSDDDDDTNNDKQIQIGTKNIKLHPKVQRITQGASKKKSKDGMRFPSSINKFITHRSRSSMLRIRPHQLATIFVNPEPLLTLSLSDLPDEGRVVDIQEGTRLSVKRYVQLSKRNGECALVPYEAFTEFQEIGRAFARECAYTATSL